MLTLDIEDPSVRRLLLASDRNMMFHSIIKFTPSTQVLYKMLNMFLYLLFIKPTQGYNVMSSINVALLYAKIVMLLLRCGFYKHCP